MEREGSKRGKREDEEGKKFSKPLKHPIPPTLSSPKPLKE